MSSWNTPAAKRHWSPSVTVLYGSSEVQTWASGGSAAAAPYADPLCMYSGGEQRELKAAASFNKSFCWSRVSDSYHHMLLVLLRSLFLSKPEGGAGTRGTSPAGWPACSRHCSLWRSSCHGARPEFLPQTGCNTHRCPLGLCSAWVPGAEQEEALPGCYTHAFSQAFLHLLQNLTASS